MNTVRNVCEIDDLDAVAYDLAPLLKHGVNADIATEFPKTVAKHSGQHDTVVQKLREDQARCVPGDKQLFIAFSNETGRTREIAAGLGWVIVTQQPPDGIPKEWPNVSGFICNPYRNRGLGRLSLMTRLQVVDEQFGGHAWTTVGKGNRHSEQMVTRAGFVLLRSEDDRNVYTYSTDKSKQGAAIL